MEAYCGSLESLSGLLVFHLQSECANTVRTTDFIISLIRKDQSLRNTLGPDTSSNRSRKEHFMVE